MAAERHRCRNLLTHPQRGHLGACCDDNSAHLVANDVWVACQRATLTVEDIATLNSDSAHLNEHAVVANDWIGNLFVSKYFGSAGGVVNRCLHARHTTRYAARTMSRWTATLLRRCLITRF